MHDDADVAVRGRIHEHAHPLGPHHQRRRVAGLRVVVRRMARTTTLPGDVDRRYVAVARSSTSTWIQVGVADEPGDEHRRGLVVDLARRADLLDAALVHHRDPVAHRERLFLVVGHEHERDADLALDALQLELHRLAQLQVERGRAARRAAARSGS